MKIIFIFVGVFYLFKAYPANWDQDYQLPGLNEDFTDYNRHNIHENPKEFFHYQVIKGREHALVYPVKITELAIPYRPFMNYLNEDDRSVLKNTLFRLTKKKAPFSDLPSFKKWLGLHDYPTDKNKMFPAPWPELPNEQDKSLGIGSTLINKNGAMAITFSCAACHSANLFGTKVLGLTNRFPRANEFFRHGKSLTPLIPNSVFKDLFNATESEMEIFNQTKDSVRFVGVKKPLNLGLDTSLAQVALSLARRTDNQKAEKSIFRSIFPRKNHLNEVPADSKPAVWWNLKYKTKWLSDGSLVQGNPIHTNFLWNEIGRGVDLKNLEKWLKENQNVIDELTAAVFASTAPQYLDFMPQASLNLEMAIKGEKHFKKSCAKCHGHYEKKWRKDQKIPLKEKVRTVRVWYHKVTPVKDVGTDPLRYQGMKYFSDHLNKLEISQSIKTIVKPQQGYVPPPLVGIWARWPYMHNNSIPNLCELLTPSNKRRKKYVAGPAVDPQTDFSTDCVGYPYPEDAPKEWKLNPEYWYDANRQGMSNSGHDQRIFLKNGEEIYTTRQKKELIEFLKTL